LSRYNRRKDANQNEIVDALEKAGCSVTDLSTTGDGVTDLLVTRAGVHYLVEVKSKDGVLTDPQIRFHVKHAPVHIVRTIEQAFRAVGLIH
jgi:Holliday junction resolvase